MPRDTPRLEHLCSTRRNAMLFRLHGPVAALDGLASGLVVGDYILVTDDGWPHLLRVVAIEIDGHVQTVAICREELG